MCVLCCIADGKKTSKLIFFRGMNKVFHMLGFITYGNTERT